MPEDVLWKDNMERGDHLNCTDANGVTRRVNYTRNGFDDPTSAAPSITGPRSMAPNSTDPKNTTVSFHCFSCFHANKNNDDPSTL
ncbi:unnamed protein product [Ranitomeya imitator]|uniref:Uncharacterized protein n=1 Tax=Ranitomeya imitator TaxID=111125 RepID=A0ABN9LG69_9NEOB|nr:unnamed protein product [Ranitomeya imitator]